MIEIVAIIIAVLTACGGIAKVAYECYKPTRDQEQNQNQVVNNYQEGDQNIESIVIEEMKRQKNASPREIDIKINVHRPKDVEKGESK